ncbi:hypothetical protein NDU88_006395 [Pleurodeles waltl]|uniref:Uncharacterized protein n=1 Tax=Pleurodeles waltl TaxID=8319 RepID=A0AAV7QJX9_PLEWA|nr:hypothetical protein NDU88_006395 [Pleurodeles waltl]
MLTVVQLSALVEGDTRVSPAASEGCPLGMMLVTVVEAAAVQVVVQMAVQVPFLEEDGPDVSLVAAVEPVDTEEEEAEEEDIDNRNNIIMKYFQ